MSGWDAAQCSCADGGRTCYHSWSRAKQILLEAQNARVRILCVAAKRFAVACGKPGEERAAKELLEAALLFSGMRDWK